MFSQTKSTIQFSHLLNDPPKAIIVNLSRSHLMDSMGLFGSLLLTQLWLSILSREAIPRETRTPVSVYLDEAHEMLAAIDCIRLLCTGSRKYAISMNIISQSPAFFGPHADTLFGTCATTISFCVDRKAGELLSKQLFTFYSERITKSERPLALFSLTPKPPPRRSIQEQHEEAISALTTLPRFHCFIRTRGDQDDGIPFVAQISPPASFHVSRDQEEEFRQQSARIYNKPVHESEAERKKRLEKFLSPPPLKKITNRS